MPKYNYDILQMFFFTLLQYLSISDILKLKLNININETGYSLMKSIMAKKQNLTRAGIFYLVAEYINSDADCLNNVLMIFPDCRDYSDLITMTVFSFSVEHVYGLFTLELDFHIRYAVMKSKNVSVDFIRRYFHTLGKIVGVFIKMDKNNKNILDRYGYMTDETFSILKDNVPTFLYAILNTRQMRHVMNKNFRPPYGNSSSDSLLQSIPQHYLTVLFQNKCLYSRDVIYVYFNYYCRDVDFIIENIDSIPLFHFNKTIPFWYIKQRYGRVQKTIDFELYNKDIFKDLGIPESSLQHDTITNLEHLQNQYFIFLLLNDRHIILDELDECDVSVLLRNPNFQRRIANGEYLNETFHNKRLFSLALTQLSLKNKYCRIHRDLFANIIDLVLRSYPPYKTSMTLLNYLHENLKGNKVLPYACHSHVVKMLELEYKYKWQQPYMFKMMMLKLDTDQCLEYIHADAITDEQYMQMDAVTLFKINSKKLFLKRENIPALLVSNINNYHGVYELYLKFLWTKEEIREYNIIENILSVKNVVHNFSDMYDFVERYIGIPSQCMVISRVLEFSMVEFKIKNYEFIICIVIVEKTDDVQDLLRKLIDVKLLSFDRNVLSMRDGCCGNMFSHNFVYMIIRFMKININDLKAIIESTYEFFTYSYVTYSFGTFFYTINNEPVTSYLGVYSVAQLKTLVEIICYIINRKIVMNRIDYLLFEKQINWTMPINICGTSRRLWDFLKKQNITTKNDIERVDFTTFDMDSVLDSDFQTFTSNFTVNDLWSGICVNDVRNMT